MKSIHGIIAGLVSGVFLLSGCVSSLTLEKDGARLAQVAGVPRTDIRFASEGFVLTVPSTKTQPEKGNYYMVVVAQDALHLLEIETGLTGGRPTKEGLRLG
jgi:hypothetical protein